MVYCVRKKNVHGDYLYWGVDVSRRHQDWWSSAFRHKYRDKATAKSVAETLANQFKESIEVALPRPLSPGYETIETIMPWDRDNPFNPPQAATTPFLPTARLSIPVSKQEVYDIEPDYYNFKLDGKGFDVLDVIEAFALNFSLGSVVKYVLRAGRKSPSAMEDLKKARTFISREIARLEKQA